jgi:hypothetical protein
MPQAIIRSVVNNLVNSNALPKIRLQVDPAFTYVGRNEFILYGIARAEQHLFVAASADMRLQRLVWVQFEAYLDDNQYTYNYSSSQTIQIAGWPFFYDAGWMDRQEHMRQNPTSDRAHMLVFLQERGYIPGSAEIFERYVTLGPDLRSELMLIYAQDAAQQDLPTLEAGGVQGEPWLSVQEGLHQHGLQSFSLYS